MICNTYAQESLEVAEEREAVMKLLDVAIVPLRKRRPRNRTRPRSTTPP